MMWGYEGWWGFAWWLHWLLPLGFLAVLVWGVLVLARTAERRGGGAGGDALAVLKERYARGELTREEFEQMRRDIES